MVWLCEPGCMYQVLHVARGLSYMCTHTFVKGHKYCFIDNRGASSGAVPPEAAALEAAALPEGAKGPMGFCPPVASGRVEGGMFQAAPTGGRGPVCSGVQRRRLLGEARPAAAPAGREWARLHWLRRGC